MGKRKIVLLSIAVFLAAVYAVQLAALKKNAVKVLKTDSQIDEILISSKKNGEIVLKKSGEDWLVGKYKADSYKAERIADSLSSVKILDTVSRSADGAALAVYALSDEQAVSAEAKSSGKTVRALEIGKTSVTGSQTYIRADGAKSVSLASGALESLFSSSVSELRSNEVYSLVSTDITAAKLENGAESFCAVCESGAEGERTWKIEGLDADSAKISSWISEIASLRADEWCRKENDSDTTFQSFGEFEETAVLEINAGGKTITVRVGKCGDKDSAVCSQSEFPFRISAYTAKSFAKTTADFAKSEAE